MQERLRHLCPPPQVLEAKVVVDRPKTNKSEGTKIAECMVADKTGCIVFSARNEQGARRGGPGLALCGAVVQWSALRVGHERQ